MGLGESWDFGRWAFIDFFFHSAWPGERRAGKHKQIHGRSRRLFQPSIGCKMAFLCHLCAWSSALRMSSTETSTTCKIVDYLKENIRIFDWVQLSWTLRSCCGQWCPEVKNAHFTEEIWGISFTEPCFWREGPHPKLGIWIFRLCLWASCLPGMRSDRFGWVELKK